VTPVTPSRASLQSLIEGCGLRLDARAYDRLWAYHGMLRAANAELNLTRLHNFESMVLKHYVDSLLVLKFEELPGPLVDMGSGPGMPGVPLAIARPGLPIILAEPRGARAEFLEEVVSRLGLEGVEVYAGKVNRRYDRPVAGVITRAVAAIPETLDLVAGCLGTGGRMLFMKGPGCDDEIAEAKSSHADSYRLAADHAYAIPGTANERRLVVYERLEGAIGPAIARYEGPIRDVTSATNPAFKEARDLLSGRGIRRQGRAILAGSRPIGEVLAKFPDRVLAWVTPAGGEPPPPGAPAGLEWVRLATELFAELDVAGTKSPLLLVSVPDFPEWQPDDPGPPGCTLFVPFQDPENVGAVLRSAAAFGVARAVLLKEAAHPFHPKASRAAGPALFQVPLCRGPSIADLGSTSATLIPLDADGDDLASAPWPERFGLVPGLEGPGLPAALRTLPRRRIPIAAGVESLNAAASVAVALYDWKTRT